MRKRIKVLDMYCGFNREFYVLLFAKVINIIGTFVGPFFTLLLTSVFAMSESNAGMILTINTIVLVGGKIAGGYFSDIYNKKKVLMFSQLISACIYILILIFNNKYISIVLLILSSFFTAMESPVVNSMVAEIVPSQKTKEAYSLLYLCANITFPIASLICGFLLNIQYKMIFVLNIFSTVLVVLVIYKYIYTDDKDTCNRVEYAKNKNNLSLVSILKELPNVSIFIAIYFFYMFSYVQMEFSLPLYLTYLFDKKGTLYLSLLLIINGITVIVFTPVFNIVMKKVDSLINFTIGGILFAFGFGGYYFSSSITYFVICTFIISIGEIFIFTESTNYVIKESPKKYRGRISSALELAFWGGKCLGISLMSMYINYFSIQLVWMVIFFIMMISSLFIGLIYRYQMLRGIDNI